MRIETFDVNRQLASAVFVTCCTMVHVIVPLMLLDALLTKLCSGEFRSKLSLSNWVLFIHMENF